jgi:hypothetical protein
MKMRFWDQGRHVKSTRAKGRDDATTALQTPMPGVPVVAEYSMLDYMYAVDGKTIKIIRRDTRLAAQSPGAATADAMAKQISSINQANAQYWKENGLK